MGKYIYKFNCQLTDEGSQCMARMIDVGLMCKTVNYITTMSNENDCKDYK